MALAEDWLNEPTQVHPHHEALYSYKNKCVILCTAVKETWEYTDIKKQAVYNKLPFI